MVRPRRPICSPRVVLQVDDVPTPVDLAVIRERFAAAIKVNDRPAFARTLHSRLELRRVRLPAERLRPMPTTLPVAHFPLATVVSIPQRPPRSIASSAADEAARDDPTACAPGLARGLVTEESPQASMSSVSMRQQRRNFRAFSWPSLIARRTVFSLTETCRATSATVINFATSCKNRPRASLSANFD